ncbi:MAG TPA: YihY/virulence factor BrkB family protein [Solirubrobacterales bacterium]|nr:YihY/virulence factor BrkB family protein [Solirubrobacterales bacterium]
MSSGSKRAIVKRTATRFRAGNLTDWAAALTYFGLLALFPALIALVSVIGLVADPRSATETLTDIVSDLGPDTAADTFAGPIESITQNRDTAGILLIASLALALWSASGYIGAFVRASNAIYETPEGRPFWKLRPLQLAVTLVMVVLAAAVLVALVVTGPLARAVGDAIGLGDGAVTAWEIAKWPVVVAVVLAMISLLYYAAPNARLRGVRWVAPGAALALAVWAIASAGFAVYVANFGSYDATYGTMGGVVVLLIWLWLTNLALLFGHQLNAERERERELAEGSQVAERTLQVEPRQAPKTNDPVGS